MIRRDLSIFVSKQHPQHDGVANSRDSGTLPATVLHPHLLLHGLRHFARVLKRLKIVNHETQQWVSVTGSRPYK